MNIGFDLDKIFINTPPFVPNWLIDKIYKGKDSDELLYRIPGKFEQKIRKISHVSLLRPPIPRNLQELKTIAQDKSNSLFLISGRFGFLEKHSQRIIEKYHLKKYFKQMFFNHNNQQPHIFKNAIINKEGIEKFVDDDLPLLTFLAKENPKKMFFWLNNRRGMALSKNLFAIARLDEVTR